MHSSIPYCALSSNISSVFSFILRWILGAIKNTTTPRATESNPMTAKYNTSVSGVNKRTTCALIPWPAALAKNHILIVCDANAAGANFVVADKPIGDSSNSPRDTKRKLHTNQSGLANAAVPPMRPGNIIMRNENPAKNNPNENFLVVDG